MRVFAALIALCVAASVITRIYLNMTENDVGVLTAIWDLFRYFTLWTNTLAGVLCAWIALGGRPPQWMAACLVVSITVVASVYHALLAKLNSYVGIDWVVDQMLHTAIPIAFVVLWLALLPKAGLRARDMIYWMGYPVIYCIYALGRGAVDGVYPYGFLNVINLGATGVAVNVAGLVVVFAIGGLLLLVIGRSSQR